METILALFLLGIVVVIPAMTLLGIRRDNRRRRLEDDLNKTVVSAEATIVGPGKVLLGGEIVYVPDGCESKAVDAWNGASLGAEVDEMVADLLSIAKKEGFTNFTRSPESESKFDRWGSNIAAQRIGKRLDRIGGFELMQTVWWRIEVEKYRTGLFQSRSLDVCWDGIGKWLG